MINKKKASGKLEHRRASKWAQKHRPKGEMKLKEGKKTIVVKFLK
jgi:hypothetical protein